MKNPTKFHSLQLDIIKAAAIVLVVAFHFFPGQLGWHMRVMPAGWFENFWQGALANGGANFRSSLVQFVFSYFYLGVNLFVIASGFGLYLSHLKSGKPINLKEFFVKRVWRLMPGAIFAIAVLFFVKGLLLGMWMTSDLHLNLFPFLGGLNLFSDQWFFPPINGETWFLGLIVQLYLFFPLLVWLYERAGEKRFLIALFAISVVFRGLYFAFWKDSVASLSYGLSVGRLFEFGFGMVLAKRFVEQQKLNRWWMLGLVGALGYFWSWSFPFADSLAGVGLFSLIWFGVAKFPAWSWWGKVAAQSYLIFLLHHPFIWVLQKWGQNYQYLFTSGAWGAVLGLGVFALFFLFSYWLAKISQKIIDRVEKVFSHGFTLLRRPH